MFGEIFNSKIKPIGKKKSVGNPEHTRLPIKAEPNSVRTLYHNGIKIRDRYYDEDGYAKKGYRLY